MYKIHASAHASLPVSINLHQVAREYSVTPATLLWATAALVLGAHSDREDVAYGIILAGRDAPLENISDMISPASAIVPLRTQLNRRSLLTTYLEQIERRILSIIPYQHYGLQRIQNHFVDAPKLSNSAVPAKVYLTGDLGQYNDDGSIRIIGRRDRLIKINGIRVDPSEPEHHLRQLGNIFSSCVVDCLDDGNSIKLAPFVDVKDELDMEVPSSGLEGKAVDEDKEEDDVGDVDESWPEIIVDNRRSARDHTFRITCEAAQRRLSEIPLITKCPNAFRSCEASPTHRAAFRTVFEQEQRLTTAADFFFLGGDSFLAIKLVSAARDCGFTITVQQVYTHPRLANLAQVAITTTLQPTESLASSPPLAASIVVSENPDNAVLSAYSNDDNICYGITLSGRDLPALEDVAGPTLSTVPIRVRTQREQRVPDFLQDTQRQLLELREYQHYGLQNIARVEVEGAKNASRFRTLLIVQQGNSKAPTGAVRSLLPEESAIWTQETRFEHSEIAYIMYTSGTSGVPKGTIIGHRAASTVLVGYASMVGFGPDSRVLQFAAFTFDTSLLEIFATLICGGCVCIWSDAQRIGTGLHDAICQIHVNFLVLTPTVAEYVEPEKVSSVRNLMLIGEPPNTQLIQRWTAFPHGSVRVMNGWGPTEASIHASTNGALRATAPQNIGRATACQLASTMLDQPQNLAANDTVGELVVCGDTLADGYLNQPALSARSFGFGLPWMIKPMRYYRTGDLIYYDPDGSIIYKGRKDLQVKVHGQRIELHEIEGYINLKTYNGPLPASALSTNLVNELRAYLQSVLPDYMTLLIYAPVDSIPMTASGKVDRRQLRESLSLSLARHRVRQPKTMV
ncbi:MAG: hypothetical protein Q9219_002066 [cf. Caloplaca sp. 3 TL-2023]